MDTQWGMYVLKRQQSHLTCLNDVYIGNLAVKITNPSYIIYHYISKLVVAPIQAKKVGLRTNLALNFTTLDTCRHNPEITFPENKKEYQLLKFSFFLNTRIFVNQ